MALRAAVLAPALLALLAGCGAVLRTGGDDPGVEVVSPVDALGDLGQSIGFGGSSSGGGSNQAGACARLAALAEDATATEAVRAAAVAERTSLGCPAFAPAG